MTRTMAKGTMDKWNYNSYIKNISILIRKFKKNVFFD